MFVRMLAGEGIEDDVVGGEPLGEYGLLGDIAELRHFSQREGAAVRSFESGQDAEEGGFPGTIRSDQSYAFAIGDGKGEVLEKRPGAE